MPQFIVPEPVNKTDRFKYKPPDNIDAGGFQIEAAQRAQKVIEMRIQGYSLTQIAQAVGYSGSNTTRVRDLIREYITRVREETMDMVEDLRQLEAERLDAMQAGLWQDATNGDPKAVNAVLAIMDRRDKLYGTYVHRDDPNPGMGGNTYIQNILNVIAEPQSIDEAHGLLERIIEAESNASGNGDVFIERQLESGQTSDSLVEMLDRSSDGTTEIFDRPDATETRQE